MNYQPKKFCIFTTQRSGSTWLTELLDSHPETRTFEELFLWRDKHRWSDPNMKTFYDFCQQNGNYRPWIIFQYLDTLNSYPDEHEKIGFKIMYNQLAPRPEILIKLVLDKYKIIHLVRNNYLDVIISIAYQNQHQISHSNTNLRTKKVTLDPSSILQRCIKEENKRIIAHLLLRFLPVSVIEVTYESLCINQDKVLAKISDFLDINVSNTGFSSQLKKINQGSYQDKIENYVEVKKVLSGTRFERFLNEKN